MPVISIRRRAAGLAPLSRSRSPKLTARRLASTRACSPIESMNVMSRRSRMIAETPLPLEGGQVLSQDRCGCHVELAAESDGGDTILLLGPNFERRSEHHSHPYRRGSDARAILAPAP